MTPFFRPNGPRYLDTHCHVDLFRDPAEVMRGAQRQSIAVVQQLMNQRMFPLTLQGLEGAMRLLSK